MFVHTVVCMRSSAPGLWRMPQSDEPAMKHDGTSIVRPAKSCISATYFAPVMQRYHWSPPWKPLRPYSAA